MLPYTENLVCRIVIATSLHSTMRMASWLTHRLSLLDPGPISFRRVCLSSMTCRDWKVDPLLGVVKAKGAKNHYQIVVGLEIHAQLKIPTKLFSWAFSSTSKTHVRDSELHMYIHPFDAAVPGKLPQLSLEAVEKATIIAAALKCTLPPVSKFERKHYTYADLPAGYQITQQRWPFALDGMLEYELTISKKKRTKIQCSVERIQLEQDTGKTTTVKRKSTDGRSIITYSQVDLSRAGCALVEIVLGPDLRSSQQAVAAVKAVRSMLTWTDSCGGHMEEGQLRVDCNVNVMTTGNCPPRKSPRIEVKNLNSLQQVHDAIEYEGKRAAEAMEAQDGVFLVEETRSWSVAEKRTVLLRSKDQALDYRFMPEPDLPSLVLENALGRPVDEFLKDNLVELPAEAEHRLQLPPYELTESQASLLSTDPTAVRLFEEAVDSGRIQEVDEKEWASFSSVVANLMCNEVFAIAKEQTAQLASEGPCDEHVSMANSPVSSSQLGEIAAMIHFDEIISVTMAKKLLRLVSAFENQADVLSPRDLAEKHGLKLISDTAELRRICQIVVADHTEELEVYKRGGKFVKKITKLFIGKAMSASRGNAHPERLGDALDFVLAEASKETK